MNTSSGYGNFTLIKHVNGYETGYGHQSKIIVEAGDKVRQGQLIGYVGSTGNSTGNQSPLNKATRNLGGRLG